jgi:predicted dehydrogenase
VHICTPNASHVPYAVALLEAGKHVLCEKPLGVGLADAEEAYAVAQRTGLVNTIPFAYRFHPMAREMRHRVQDEAGFGAVNLVHGHYLQDWLLDPRSTSWRVDPKAGGPSRAFGDIGSHWCDLAEWVSGERITSLVATTSITIKQRPDGTVPAFSAAPVGRADGRRGDRGQRPDHVPHRAGRGRVGGDQPALRRPEEPALA